MSVFSTVPLAKDIDIIRKNYDTSKRIIAEILRAKEERLKVLEKLNKQYQEDFHDSGLLLKNERKKQKRSTSAKERKSESDLSLISLRRSTRLLNSPNVRKSEPAKSQINRPPNDYGSVPGVEVGAHWETRMECSLCGVHRPTVAGIHGGPEGAYSIALSGGYPEDIDEGDFFVYTGAGGRDLKGTLTKPKNLRIASQTKDQVLEGTNMSLVKSIESKLPVRVIRGYKSDSVFAPETGYRYDGLYRVVKYWEDIGKTGYKIYRFRMERLEDQPPPPWVTKERNDAPKESAKAEDEDFENKFSFNDDLEFKENIPPAERGISSDVCLNYKDMKEIDNEIQMCIKFFCEVTPDKHGQDLSKDSEEEFQGWDFEIISSLNSS